ncbi:MAG: hypothetical protein IJD39_04130 [Clostridia bacterium]|nr:hypothetical protein [Clostridia bacterium]
MRKMRTPLFTTLLMIILCASIVAGSTLAYFTSEVGSESNIVAAKELKAGMQWSSDGEDWKNAADTVIFNHQRWEPNYADVKYLLLENAGGLAFEYELNIVPTHVHEGKGNLLDVIDVYFGVIGQDTPAITRANFKSVLQKAGTLTQLLTNEHGAGYGLLLPASSGLDHLSAQEKAIAHAGSVKACIVLHMQETAGNEYQGKSVGEGFRVILNASQYNDLPDAFGRSGSQGSNLPQYTVPTQVTVSVTPGADGLLTQDVVLRSATSGIHATVPAGAKMADGATALTLNITPMAGSAQIQLGENQIRQSYDVHVGGLAADNTVPVIIYMGPVLEKGLNIGNYQLYHVENGQPVAMPQDANLDTHNDFTYDPVTGDVTIALATFSEVAVVADTEAKWKGEFDYTWYDASKTEMTIANADQLAAFGAIVGGMNGQTQDSFAGQTVKLIADVNLGDKESENNPDLIFYPIGYYNSAKSYKKTSGGSVTSNVNSFEGTFDGNGHTVKNFYQNTWEMFGDYNNGYSGTPNHYKDAMGLFGYVVNGTIKNLTVDHFSSDGEFTPTGVIAAYAVNSTFENIAITNCNPRVYNTGNGGIVGIGGNSDDPDTYKLTFTNITIDNTNTISALWGSWDVACGGLVGMFRGAGMADFKNCHVAAQIDVYNDVCGNYQYYWYRYSGMMIGSIRKNMTKDGYTVPDPTGITFTGCTATYGPWADYVYCEFTDNSQASYTEDYQFSRVEAKDLKVVGNQIECTHTHKDVEDKRAVLLPFNQLFNGYGYGVKAVTEYDGVEIIHKDSNDAIRSSDNKFEYIHEIKELEADREYKIKELFGYISGKPNVSSTGVVVSITDLDNTDGIVSAEYTVNNEVGWEENTIKFSGTGKVQLIIQDYYFCTPTVIEVNVTDRQPEVKFDIVMNNGDFLHRVGNIGTVALDKLFKAKDGVTVGTVTVTVEAVDGTGASGTYSNNAIQFSGTGVVKVTITDNDYCIPTELYLEVVDAKNATTAANATDNNVVLLNDCGFSSLEVSDGYTLYGNGFTMTCASDSAALDMGYAFVTLNNGTLDNVQIVCPNFDYAALYKSNLTSSENRSETTDKTRYYNAKSGVMASGNSQILNSRISGGRAAVNVSGGNCVIDNSRIELGAVASVLVGAANSLTLRDVTLVQKPTASTYDSSKSLMGFSVLYLCDSEGKATPTTLEGSFVQQAWVNADDKQYVPSAGQDIVDGVMKETAFIHNINGKDSLNLGFAYMPEDAQKTVAAPDNITDNRTDKATIPYEMKDVEIKIAILNTTVYVYSYKNTNGTADSFKTETEYVPNRYSDIITVTYSDTADGLTTGKSYGTDGWVYELNVDLDKLSGYALDFSKLSMSVNGVKVTDFMVNGNAKPTSPVAVTAGGTTYTLTATVNGKECTATYKVTGTETSKESPSLVGTPSYGEGFGVANKYGGDWSAAAPVLEGITIRYWSVADSEYKEFALSSITFANTGKQNGTNNYWEYTHTNNDFTLKLTNTAVIHSSSGTYGMPVAGKDGRLYFTIASSGGFVSTGTTSRSITIAYEFTDNNGGDTLKFSHTWSIPYSKDKQYNYSSFTSDGTLTLLEAGSGGDSCVTPDTLFTMADGTQKRADALAVGDMVRVLNHITGQYEAAPIIFNNHADDNEEKEYRVLHLQFANGKEVKIVASHGFYDMTLMKYVYITYDNYRDYIGHEFYSLNSDGTAGERVKLEKAFIETEKTRIFCPVSYFHMNSFANGFLNTPNIPGDITGLVNYFEYDDDLKYNEEAMQRDIEEYGVYTYDDFKDYISEAAFRSSPSIHLKVAVGKGMITYEQILDVIKYLLAGSLIE